MRKHGLYCRPVSIRLSLIMLVYRLTRPSQEIAPESQIPLYVIRSVQKVLSQLLSFTASNDHVSFKLIVHFFTLSFSPHIQHM